MCEVNNVIQEVSFDSGFPERFRNEYAHVISMISKAGTVSVKVTDAYNSEKEIYVLTDGTQIKFPYRIYCPVDDHAYSQLTDIEKLIYDCIFTRHNDGYIREKHIRNLLRSDIPEWCFPYIVRSSADYVLAIVNAIYDRLKQCDNSLLQTFCRNNPGIVRTNYRRAYSYWNVYYRRDFPELRAYVGMKLFSECLLPNLNF